MKENKLDSQTNTATAIADFYLPDDCWECIFIKIRDRHDLNSLSVVSKQFLSVIDGFQFSLPIYDETHHFLPRLFHRFTNLTSLSFSYYFGDLNNLLHEISLFPLKLTSLNISYKKTIPTNGLRDFSQNVTTLTSLTCSRIQTINSTDLFLIADCFPLLEQLNLRNPLDFNYQLLDGVETLPLSFLKLRKINLSNHGYINDQLFFHLFKNCKLLEEAIMVCCDGVTNVGIVKMIVENYNSLTGFVVNPRLNSLNLAKNRWITDESITMIASSFPNLQLLDLTFCDQNISKGICEVLKRCRKIRHLILDNCSKVKVFEMNYEVPNLEVLNLSNTLVDDETLNVISKSCHGLLHMILQRCDDVTEKGVKHVVENCTQLREIDFYGCNKAHFNVVPMVLSRPSLRKVTTPKGINHLSYQDRKVLSRQRCDVQ